MEYIPAKTIVIRTKSTSWFGTDYNMNIYKGCCHGCIYCDSRSECYHVDDFDRVRAKENALEIIRNDLRRKVRPGVVGTGSMSDPYNPFEKELQLTRHALELISAYGFGAAVYTKSDLIMRDIDVLQEIRSFAPVTANITITTADDDLAARLEPRAPSPSRRFQAVNALSKAGIFCGILLMPVLPFLEDGGENILAIVRRAKECGARFIYPFFGLTMRQNQREWLYQKLEELFPDGGLQEKYRSRYGNAYRCFCPKAKELYQLFCAECDRLGLLYNMRDIVGAYKMGYGDSQLSLFSQ